MLESETTNKRNEKSILLKGGLKVNTNIKLKELRHIVGYNVKLVDQESGVELIDHSPLNSEYDEWYVVKMF